jgi:ribonucleotide reductase alpha subunit
MMYRVFFFTCRLLDMAADRGAFIDQSQSLNVYIASPNIGKLSSMHFHGWKIGLKTGMYYLRTRPAAEAIKFTVDHQYLSQVRMTTSSMKKLSNQEESSNNNNEEQEYRQMLSCSLQNPQGCLSCGS